MSDLINDAMEMLDNVSYWDTCPEEYKKRIHKLKEALEQPHQEPYAWEVCGKMIVNFITCDKDYVLRGVERGEFTEKPLYTHPLNVRRLSVDEVNELAYKTGIMEMMPYGLDSGYKLKEFYDVCADACNIPKDGE